MDSNIKEFYTNLGSNTWRRGNGFSGYSSIKSSIGFGRSCTGLTFILAQASRDLGLVRTYLKDQKGKCSRIQPFISCQQISSKVAHVQVELMECFRTIFED